MFALIELTRFLRRRSYKSVFQLVNPVLRAQNAFRGNVAPCYQHHRLVFSDCGGDVNNKVSQLHAT